MINNYNLITYAPIRFNELLGKTIQTKPYLKASVDSTTLDLFFFDVQGNAFNFTDLHFTDLQGKVSCVPLALCQTWFGLVKHIVEDCIDDEFDLLKEELMYELLNGGSAFQLVAEEDFLVTMESWLQVLEKKTGIINMRLVDHHGRLKSLLVTHIKGKAHKSGVASDASSVIMEDRGDDATEPPPESISDGTSDTTLSSTASSTAEGKSKNLANKLYGLQAKLQEAKTQVDWERVLALSNEIPSLETRILEWTAENLRLELREKGDVFEEDEATSTASSGRRRGPQLASVVTSSRTSIDGALPKSGSSSRSGSRSQSTSSFPNCEQLISARDPTKASEVLRIAKQPSVTRSCRRNVSPAQNISYNSSFGPLRSSALSREHSYVSPRSWAPLQPLSCQQSRWNTRKLHESSGEYLARVSPQNLSSESRRNIKRSGVLSDRNENSRGSRGFSVYNEKDRGKLDSDNRPGRTRNNNISQPPALRNHAQGPNQGSDDIIGETSRYDTPADRANKLPAVVADWLRLPKTVRAPPAPSDTVDNKEIHMEQSAMFKNQQNDGALKNLHNGARPALRRLVNLVHKATAHFSHLNAGEKSADPPTLFIAKDTESVPIFLWPTKQKPASPQVNVPRTYSVEQEENPTLFSAKLGDKAEESLNVSKMKEQVLQTLLAEVHNSLMKPRDPRKLSREHAMFYEGTVGRTAIEAAILGPPESHENNEQISESTKLTTPMKQGRMERVDGDDSDRMMTARESSGPSAGTHPPGSHSLQLKSNVFSLAGKMLHAFVPPGYDDPIISKYWGAVHKLLRQDVLLFGSLAVIQMVASNLTRLHQRILDVQRGMRTIDGSQPNLDQLPKSFIAAFQHLIMLFVVAGNMAELCSSNSSNLS